MILHAMDTHLSKGETATSDSRDSYVKSTWENAFEGDDAVSSSPSATKKLRFAARQSVSGAEASSSQDRSGPMHPTGAPHGLFDFHTEAEKIRQSSRKDTKKALLALKDRSKATKFTYDDRDTLLLAFDLYNCSNKVYRKRHCHNTTILLWDSTRLFECKDVVGNHTLPCDECGEVKFRKESDVYFVDFWGSAKVCTGCMGRNVCYLFGTDREEITAKLSRMKEMHRRTRRVIGPNAEKDADYEYEKELEP